MGRSIDADIRLDSQRVSGKHVKIDIKENMYLNILKSKNGVSIDKLSNRLKNISVVEITKPTNIWVADVEIYVEPVSINQSVSNRPSWVCSSIQITNSQNWDENDIQDLCTPYVHIDNENVVRKSSTGSDKDILKAIQNEWSPQPPSQNYKKEICKTENVKDSEHDINIISSGNFVTNVERFSFFRIRSDPIETQDKISVFGVGNEYIESDKEISQVKETQISIYSFQPTNERNIDNLQKENSYSEDFNNPEDYYDEHIYTSDAHSNKYQSCNNTSPEKEKLSSKEGFVDQNMFLEGENEFSVCPSLTVLLPSPVIPKVDQSIETFPQINPITVLPTQLIIAPILARTDIKTFCEDHTQETIYSEFEQSQESLLLESLNDYYETMHSHAFKGSQNILQNTTSNGFNRNNKLEDLDISYKTMGGVCVREYDEKVSAIDISHNTGDTKRDRFIFKSATVSNSSQTEIPKKLNKRSKSWGGFKAIKNSKKLNDFNDQKTITCSTKEFIQKTDDVFDSNQYIRLKRYKSLPTQQPTLFGRNLLAKSKTFPHFDLNFTFKCNQSGYENLEIQDLSLSDKSSEHKEYRVLNPLAQKNEISLENIDGDHMGTAGCKDICTPEDFVGESDYKRVAGVKRKAKSLVEFVDKTMYQNVKKTFSSGCLKFGGKNQSFECKQDLILDRNFDPNRLSSNLYNFIPNPVENSQSTISLKHLDDISGSKNDLVNKSSDEHDSGSGDILDICDTERFGGDEEVQPDKSCSGRKSDDIETLLELSGNNQSIGEAEENRIVLAKTDTEKSDGINTNEIGTKADFGVEGVSENKFIKMETVPVPIFKPTRQVKSLGLRRAYKTKVSSGIGGALARLPPMSDALSNSLFNPLNNNTNNSENSYWGSNVHGNERNRNSVTPTSSFVSDYSQPKASDESTHPEYIGTKYRSADEVVGTSANFYSGVSGNQIGTGRKKAYLGISARRRLNNTEHVENVVEHSLNVVKSSEPILKDSLKKPREKCIKVVKADENKIVHNMETLTNDVPLTLDGNDTKDYDVLLEDELVRDFSGLEENPCSTQTIEDVCGTNEFKRRTRSSVAKTEGTTTAKKRETLKKKGGGTSKGGKRGRPPKKSKKGKN
ncbi:hypothetical protein BB559_003449 [Furculomyces boomerangus]|uniref:FHA domain-containing protein n=1 Tax=Furculomyces boomerangus TaxID=61424 RepID=A0A2T9YL76_9FUNG|nr:hypothetical protein BB559_003449 [Furculomyces boomerangus]